MTRDVDPFSGLIDEARKALQNRQKIKARRLAHQALKASPDNEDAWLILAGTANPRASLVYYSHALEINPASQRARRGIHWALQRIRTQPDVDLSTSIQESAIHRGYPPHSPKRNLPYLGIALLSAILILAAVGLFIPMLYKVILDYPVLAIGLQEVTPSPVMIVDSTDPSLPTPFLPASNTPTLTPTALPTETPTDVLPSIPAELPSTTSEIQQQKEPASPPSVNVIRPRTVADNEFWIDVDLSQQRLYAYQGDQLLQTFAVSTGLKSTPTVTGRFRVYVKYRIASMSGPGYYLEGVPFVMYFYKDYGLHGTYWHNNFGHPMSHGCVNLKTVDASWIYKHSIVGTVVNVHR